MSTLKPAVFFDRDGVLCQAIVRDGRPYPPPSLAEMQLMPGARLTCEALKNAGYLLVMVTNQPDIARGAQTRQAVDEINQHLETQLQLDGVEVCPHQDSDGCGCRKPAPGMLQQAAQHLNIELEKSFMVGDRWRDVEAGRAAGCQTVFIDYHYGEQQPLTPGSTVNSLLEAAEHILLSTPNTAPNSAAEFLIGVNARTRAISEFRKPQPTQTPAHRRNAVALALETER